MPYVLLPLMRERRFDTLDQLVNAVLDGRDPHLAGRVVSAWAVTTPPGLAAMGVPRGLPGAGHGIDAPIMPSTRSTNWSTRCWTGAIPIWRAG
jgi:hypothetical protein